MVEGAMKMLEDVAMTRIDGLKAVIVEKDAMIARMDREIAAKDVEIKALLSRIAYLEEALASKGETRVITKEEWAENFK
jgi:hypothetical protein